MKNLWADLKHYQPMQKILLLVILGLAVHLILPQITTLEHSWQQLKSLIPWAVTLAFTAQVLSYVSSGYLLKIILNLSHVAINLWHSTVIVLGAASIGLVAGGLIGSSAAIYHWTNQDGKHSEGATLASILPSILNSIVIVLISIFGLAHLLLTHDLSRTQLITFSSVLFVLVVLIFSSVFFLQHRKLTTSMIIWLGTRSAKFRHKPFVPTHSQEYARKLFSVWDSLRDSNWELMLISALLNVVFDMATLYFLFVAAGHAVNPGVLLTGYGLPLLLGKMAFVIPGGVGVIESSMAALYTSLGVPSTTTVIVVLGYRFISFWLPSLSGFPIAAFLQRLKPRNEV